ncbi:uncharacterized protein LOC119515614 isoform X2 [Choloepus didactylus]|uniref:uncharacterized protein LOC119515614 isoform X2 n=1 Tax=Choloepus didactylus TaxID=27675 RepID=UPI00189FC159|nr:uncharacterized protein LOC119515614 isoform X2 [Choloepus didactylus]
MTDELVPLAGAFPRPARTSPESPLPTEPAGGSYSTSSPPKGLPPRGALTTCLPARLASGTPHLQPHGAHLGGSPMGAHPATPHKAQAGGHARRFLEPTSLLTPRRVARAEGSRASEKRVGTRAQLPLNASWQRGPAATTLVGRACRAPPSSLSRPLLIMWVTLASKCHPRGAVAAMDGGESDPEKLSFPLTAILSPPNVKEAIWKERVPFPIAAPSEEQMAPQRPGGDLSAEKRDLTGGSGETGSQSFGPDQGSSQASPAPSKLANCRRGPAGLSRPRRERGSQHPGSLRWPGSRWTCPGQPKGRRTIWILDQGAPCSVLSACGGHPPTSFQGPTEHLSPHLHSVAHSAEEQGGPRSSLAPALPTTRSAGHSLHAAGSGLSAPPASCPSSRATEPGFPFHSSSA